jgi:hypothetical protein
MQQTDLTLGINFGFENDKFFVEYRSCNYKPDNLKEEFEKRARQLYLLSDKLMLGISSGLDSQAVMHSFCSQGLDIEYAFLYMPGYNEIEYEQLQILIKKYSIDPVIIEINPEEIKDKVLFEYRKTKVPPNQQIHRTFLSKLPSDRDFIQGIHGPDFFFKDNETFVVETANSLELSRLIAFQSLDRKGKIIGWERTSEILTSLLTDDVVSSFLYSYNYISNNRLVYNDGTPIPLIDYWDVYIKPYLYGKYWKDELEYFPKYQGCENIDWIIEGRWHDFGKNRVAISYNHLLTHLTAYNGSVVRFYEP